MAQLHAGDSMFHGGRLPADHPVSWRSIMSAPKEPHTISVRCQSTVNYHVLHTGGFVRLCSDRGRCYWVTQNETGHRSPDWKIHVSVELQDIAAAWDVVAATFLEWGCDFGMKATTLNEQWPEEQRGREITVYIYVHDSATPLFQDGGPQGAWLSAQRDCEERPTREEQEALCAVWLSAEFERDGATYWKPFVKTIESRLTAHGLRSPGCADGDLSLGGRYCSLRNEAFVPPDHEPAGEPCYPSNRQGWNAVNHPCDCLPIRGLLSDDGATRAAQTSSNLAVALTSKAKSVLAAIVAAQDGGAGPSFRQALKEIRAGRKTSHWIWWVWPTLGVLRPKTSRPSYLLPDFRAACGLLEHPTLAARLCTITSAAAEHLNAGRTPRVLFGSKTDVEKFEESVTLFFCAACALSPDSKTPNAPPPQELCKVFARALSALQRTSTPAPRTAWIGAIGRVGATEAHGCSTAAELELVVKHALATTLSP
mmetsp:Transcript_64539/g.134596  ORF Transcript_64539/g.134596 Transcript_64539/m.134596 type:complete len:481 (-) Transcript_64539:396-1838(-)